MALQHLRSSTANKRPTPASMLDGQLAINSNDSSPGLFFKDSNGALVKVGPVHVGATAPNASPASGGSSGNSIGEQWLDTSSSRYLFKIWDGTAWRSEDGEFVNSNGDTMTGALVMDNQQQIRFRETTANGTNYVALQAPASVSSDKTITLPDVTGTVVTTGDTGSITGTMLVTSIGLSGTPTTPTASADTNTTQIASTAFVVGQAGSSTPLINGTAAVGTSLRYSRQDHVHPTDSTRAPLASPTFTGTVNLPAVSYSGNIDSTSTGYLDLPTGTTGERPGSPNSGMIRFNSTLSQFEGHNGTAWGQLGGGATGGGSDTVFIENGQTVTTNYTLSTNKNAVSAGPITINSGVTVTVPSGSSWVIV